MPQIPETVFSQYAQSSEESFNTVLISAYEYLVISSSYQCFSHLLLKQPKRVLMLCTKAPKIAKIGDKEKFIFGMYKAEALNMLGSIKQSYTASKETPVILKPETQFECTFGYWSPWVDSTVQYNAKTIQAFNTTALALQDEQESGTKETSENLRRLMEQTEPDLQSQTSPLSTLVVYNILRKGQQHQALHYLKRRKILEQQTGPTTKTPSTA